MSISNPRFSSKRQLYPIINNLIITPSNNNYTTANSSHKSTLIMNTEKGNFCKKEKKLNSLSKVSSKNEKDVFFLKYKKLEKKTNLSCHNMIKNKILKPKANSCNKNEKSSSKIINNTSNQKKKNYSIIDRTNESSKKKIHNNIITFKGEAIKFNNKNIIKLPKNVLVKGKFNESKNKEKNNLNLIKFQNPEEKRVIISEGKYNNSLDRRNLKKLNNKGKSRNYSLKIPSSSVRNNSKNSSISYKRNTGIIDNSKNSNNKLTNKTCSKISGSNPKNKRKIGKTVYNKKNKEASFNLMNIRSSSQERYYNKNIGNHNCTVLFLKKGKSKKKMTNYKILENKGIKNIKINSFSKSKNKKNGKINLTTDNESSIKKIKIFSKVDNKNNIKKMIFKRVKNYDKNNKISTRNKSDGNKKLKLNNKNKKNKIVVKDRKRNNNLKMVNKNIETNDKSIISLGKKDRFYDLNENIPKKSYKEKNERDTKINNIKINEFEVKKPKEENMKFALLKNGYSGDESTEEINKPIIIGTIESYKDIFNNDKFNNDLFQKEASKNVLESNAIDNLNINKKKNKGILLNNKKPEQKNIYEKKDKITNIDSSEIYYNDSNNGLEFNDSEIKSLLNYVGNDINDLSTTILKLNKTYKNSCLLPYRVNMIYFVKKYDNKEKKYILNENINNDNVLLINKKSSILNNQYNSEKNKIGKIKSLKSKEILWNEFRNNINFKKQNNNIIQKRCNIFIEGNEKKCNIF